MWWATAEADGLLAQVKKVRPDLILLDWELPGPSSNDLLPVLRSLCPHLKVIALSGRPEARQAALDAGADAFVSRVEPPERLLAVLRNAVA
jgi:DNA-binding NarL/FixJ family response regulator